MRQSPRLLIVEDDATLAESLKHMLESEGYAVETAPTGAAALTRAGQEAFDLVVTDLQLPDGATADVPAGLEVIRQLHESQPRLPIILMTAHHTADTAIEATKRGAYDYILKPFDPGELLALIETAVASSRLVIEPVALGDTTSAPQAIIGQSKAMQNVYKEIGRLAAKPVTVLIRGETGTGKELVARALYQHSDRLNQPLIVVNCVAIPETLLESELFGHEQGAFTGASTRRIGRFEQAHRGTIFLDEIGDMTMSTQAKLLRVLQEKTIQRLGGREPIPVDVRILAATHCDLELALREHRFREDLYYRLNVAVIALPPLRDRRDDIPALAQYFLNKHGPDLGAPQANILPDGLERLQQQVWPGNVRELENIVRKSILLARGYPIRQSEVDQALVQAQSMGPAADQTLAAYVTDLLQQASRGERDNVQGAVVSAAERELYTQAIALAHGNQARAAKWLGVSRPTMRDKLTQYGLLPPRGE